MAQSERKKLGETLVEAGLIDDLQLRSALADQKRWGNRLGKTLVKLGFVEEDPLMRHLSRLMGYPLAEIAGREIDDEVLALIPAAVAQKHRCLPLFVDDDGACRYLYLGMEEPADLDTLDSLQLRTGLEICPVLVGFCELDDGLRRYYGVGLDGDRAATSDSADFEIGGRMVGPDCLRHGDEVLDDGSAPAPGEPAGSDVSSTANLDESFEVGSAPEKAPASPQAPAGVQAAEKATPAAAASERAEVPTRRILQALTQVLVDKGVMTRDELVAQVKALSARDDG